MLFINSKTRTVEFDSISNQARAQKCMISVSQITSEISLECFYES